MLTVLENSRKISINELGYLHAYNKGKYGKIPTKWRAFLNSYSGGNITRLKLYWNENFLTVSRLNDEWRSSLWLAPKSLRSGAQLALLYSTPYLRVSRRARAGSSQAWPQATMAPWRKRRRRRRRRWRRRRRRRRRRRATMAPAPA